MVMLTVVRRLALFVVFIGVIINGLFLVLANRATAHPDKGGAALTLHVHLRDKASADALVSAIKKDHSDDGLRTEVTSAQRTVDVSTGKYGVAIELDEEYAPSVTNTLKTVGVDFVAGSSGDKRRTLSLKESFASKAQAEARVKQVGEKTGGLVNMSAVELKVKKQMTVWTVDVALPDETAFEEMRVYVRKKQPSADLEP